MKPKPRCRWAGTRDYMIAYHDLEWGRPVYDDQKHFEMLTLESAQAGLSWDTILRRRENYRKAFADFDPKKVAKFGRDEIAKLLNNEGIIRNKLKVHAAVSNARLFLEIQKEFGSFTRYIWSFVGNQPIPKAKELGNDFRATSPESDALAKDLKKRGFKFCGSTIMYAHLQAAGLMNDHSPECFLHGRKFKTLKKF